MDVLIVAVNYDSYYELNRFLNSVDNAMANISTDSVTVIVADNSINKMAIDISQYENISVNVKPLLNLGYLGGAQKVINSELKFKQYDYVVISNVDIEVDSHFFYNLFMLNLSQDIGWIAPQIWSEEEERDKNPKVIERYSKSKLEKIRLLYKYPILDYIYTNTFYLKKKVRPQYNEMDIYAGHGSFMILTKRFFDFYKEIHYPIFLFGEELFLAELNRRAGLCVRYIPDLKILDNEHVSTSKMKKRSYYKYNLDSINYILDTFYE